MQILTLYVNIIILKCTPTYLIEDEKSSQMVIKIIKIKILN